MIAALIDTFASDAVLSGLAISLILLAAGLVALHERAQPWPDDDQSDDITEGWS